MHTGTKLGKTRETMRDECAEELKKKKKKAEEGGSGR